MAGAWVQTHKNGKRETSPFTLSGEELDNLERNTTDGTTYTFVNAITRQRRVLGKKYQPARGRELRVYKLGSPSKLTRRRM
jgi:hypothetical protein